MRLTREIGFPYHSFCADVLDPFFSGDRSYQIETAQAVKEAAARHGVTIVDVYTGVATHRFHGLSHSDARCRERMKQWIREIYPLAAAMGSPNVGGHWDAFSVEVLEDGKRTVEAWDRIVAIMRELAVDAKRAGIEALYSEQMYIPSEVPWTLAQTERFLIECNRDNPNGCPVRVALDTGHMAGMHYGLSGSDLDYTEWLRRFGAQTQIIHVQQTSPEGSHHWPFTDAFNAKGHVDIDKAIEAIVAAHREYEASPVSKHVPWPEAVYLVCEIIPGSTKTESALLEELSISAKYLRKFVPEGGLTVEI
jgi:sugar phosphate isomerase/epimerase